MRELGDLIGHADLGDKGQFVTHLEDLCAMTRFHFSGIQLTRDQLEALDSMISEDSFKAAVQAVVRNLSDKELRDLLGLKRAEAASLAESALNRVKFRDGYNISIGQANESERKFLNQCARLLCVKPMFQTDKLVIEFVRC